MLLIDTKNSRILGINSKTIYDIVNIYEEIFNNNFEDIITQSKRNLIYNILYKSINKHKYLFYKNKLKKYIKKTNLRLNYYKVLEMFISKDDFFSSFIDKEKLYKLLNIYIRKNNHLKLLNINDYFLINKNNKYKYFIKWKNNNGN